MIFIHNEKDFSVTVEVHNEDADLDEILQFFTYFLRGCSYSIDSGEYLSKERFD